MSTLPSLADVRGRIDHAILKPEFTRVEVDEQLDMAAEHEIFSVCVRPSDIAHAVSRLEGRVAVGTVIGFPHGTTSTASKVAESRQALTDGATELDMVLNIGWLRSGMLDEVAADIASVVDVSGDRVVKVIFETSVIDEQQIVAACRAAEAAGADFVKTSTGFAGGGATVEHVRLMRATIGPSLQVKASGGVRGLDALLELTEAGATRFGTSATATILAELAARLSGDSTTVRVDESSY